MNEIEVERQIEQMVKFIRQEAEEKANEIRVSAEEEFNLEKLQLLEQGKAKIRKEYERREGQVDVKKKIEASKTINEMRLKVLAAREGAISEVVKEARTKIKGLSSNAGTYKKLLVGLLVQGMARLNEPEAVVRCRQADAQAVKESLEAARTEYANAFKTNAPKLSLDSSSYLPPAPVTGDEADSCCGGVVLSSTDGRIVCNNTLDDRIKIAYQANLPTIRKVLFN